MARTVDTTMDPPALGAIAAQSEIADLTALGGGLQRTAQTLNTLWENKRTALVTDFRNAADPILSATGQVARWRAPVQGRSGTADSLVVYVVPAVTRLAGTLRLTVTVSDGTSTSSVTHDWTTSSTTPVTITGLTVPAGTGATDVLDITAQWSVLSGTWTTQNLVGLGVFYQRNQLALPAVSSGTTYPDNFVPLEVDSYGGERPLTAARAHELHHDAEVIYETRLAPVVTSARPASPMDPTDGTIWDCTVPDGVTEAKIWLRVSSYVPAGLTIMSVSSNQGTATFSNPGVGWHEATFTVQPGTIFTPRISKSGLGSVALDSINHFWSWGSLT